MQNNYNLFNFLFGGWTDRWTAYTCTSGRYRSIPDIFKNALLFRKKAYISCLKSRGFSQKRLFFFSISAAY